MRFPMLNNITFFVNFRQYSGDSIHAQWMFMQQVEHENSVLNYENYDSIT